MRDQNLVICFLGSGNMAEAIIKGLISSETVPASRIIVTDCLNVRLEYLTETYGVKVRSLNSEAVRDSDVIFLTVKPHHIVGVLQEIAPTLGEDSGTGERGKKLLISIAAGITTATILDSLRDHGLSTPFVPIVRAMPNIPVTVGQGMTVLTAGAGADAQNLQTAKGLFQAVGCAITLDDEGLIDAVTALSGSGPAYFFFFMEALVQAGIKAGLPSDKARALALQTAMGAAAMACNSEHTLTELRRMVTSPGGTTEAALKVFSASDLNDVVEKALLAARDRSEELSGRK